MNRTLIDVHVVQTVPPSNINRDDAGSPKTAVYGGERRARVSSQAWKRAVRMYFRDNLDASELGWRTKQIVDELAKRITSQAQDLEPEAQQLAVAALKAAGVTTAKPPKKDVEESGYLVFLSSRQYDSLAAAAVEAARNGEKLAPKHAKQLVDTDHSIDLALFGRMVADAPDLNVDAACQVAHALSVHAVSNEFDYYTAVDDSKQRAEETGAGMIGTVEFNSATLYRYATIDVDALQENLGDAAAARRAVEEFLRAFTLSMPTGKQNTFANRTLPDLVAVRLRDSQPINFVGAFEEAMRSKDNGYVAAAAQRLAEYVKEVEDDFGETPVRSWVTATGRAKAASANLGEAVALPQLIAAAGEEVDARLGAA